jgi:transposase-like protein
MDFPIIDLLDTQRSLDWLEQHFHRQGMCCPQCGASRDEGRLFRINRGSGLPVYRCRHCDRVYNVYSQTLFAGSQLSAPQVVLLLQGILQGKTSRQLARELDLTEVTVLLWRHRVQAQAEQLQPETALSDLNTESDEMFQNAGEKRD